MEIWPKTVKIPALKGLNVLLDQYNYHLKLLVEKVLQEVSCSTHMFPTRNTRPKERGKVDFIILIENMAFNYVKIF